MTLKTAWLIAKTGLIVGFSLLFGFIIYLAYLNLKEPKPNIPTTTQETLTKIYCKGWKDGVATTINKSYILISPQTGKVLYFVLNDTVTYNLWEKEFKEDSINFINNLKE